MGKLLQLSNYKKSRRESFYKKHGERLEAFLDGFISKHINTSFTDIAEEYLHRQLSNDATAWDYLDLREIIHDALHEVFAEMLITELKKTGWHDPNIISVDHLIEQILSTLILGTNQRAKIS